MVKTKYICLTGVSLGVIIYSLWPMGFSGLPMGQCWRGWCRGHVWGVQPQTKGQQKLMLMVWAPFPSGYPTSSHPAPWWRLELSLPPLPLLFTWAWPIGASSNRCKRKEWIRHKDTLYSVTIGGGILYLQNAHHCSNVCLSPWPAHHLFRTDSWKVSSADPSYLQS